jgi:hypothetical protein
MGRACSMLEHMNTERVLFGKPEETRPLGRPRSGIILKRTLEKQNAVVCTRLIWLKTGKRRGLLRTL